VVRQTGSHRRLKSAAGCPPLTFAWHDGATIDEVRELAHSGAEFSLERPVEVEDRLPQVHGEADGSS
jgi:predicted RNase H-like HicB family nuclease